MEMLRGGESTRLVVPPRSAAKADAERMASLALAMLGASAAMVQPPPFVPRRLYLDWVALNSKSTTRHIQRPPTAAGKEDCMLMKQELLAAQNSGIFVVDAFSEMAAERSIDEASSTSGGLLGQRLRQGVVQLPELDKACFCSPLGRVTSRKYPLLLLLHGSTWFSSSLRFVRHS